MATKTKLIATDKSPDDLPPQARLIVKTARGGATKDRVLRVLEATETAQKPGRILSYYKARLVKDGFIKLEEGA